MVASGVVLPSVRLCADSSCADEAVEARMPLCGTPPTVQENHAGKPYEYPRPLLRFFPLHSEFRFVLYSCVHEEVDWGHSTLNTRV